MLKIVCSVALIAVVCNVQPASGQGNNLYLPPKEPGYDYPKPGGPSSSPGGPSPPPARPNPSKPPSDEAHEPGMPFDFNYAVNDIDTSNDYNHKANSDGDITKGEYRVNLPDGRTQVVRYTADWKNGYNAEVSYE